MWKREEAKASLENNLSSFLSHLQNIPLYNLISTMTFWIRSLLLLALIAVLAPIASHARPASQHLCGPQLVEALYFVCEDRGFYEEEISGKRRNIQESLANGVEALSFLPQNLKKRGIVEQCCENICSLYDLESYCN